MKKITILNALSALCILGNIALKAQNVRDSFTLEGKITGQTKGWMYLYHPGNDGKMFKDSAIIKNGGFVFKGILSAPSNVFFYGDIKSMDMDDPNSTSFFIEPGVITISVKAGDFKHALITGSKTQDEARELDNSKAGIYKEMETLRNAYTKISNEYRQAIKDKKPQAVLDSFSEKAAAMHDELQSYSPQFAAIDYKFFASHPNSYVTAFNLRFYTTSLTLDSLKMFYNNMNAALQQSGYGKGLAKEIEQIQNGSPGAVAKNFTTNDINGNKLSLADFKGKYILLDFWASWCVPCRHSNPHLKELFAKYHGNGLDIIGVSDDDRDNSAWKNAVAKDGINIWHHVLRGLNFEKLQKGEPNDADISGMFGVHTLPTKILIDKTGVIIGRYDKATDEEQAEMDKKLASLLE